MFVLGRVRKSCGQDVKERISQKKEEILQHKIEQIESKRKEEKEQEQKKKEEEERYECCGIIAVFHF